MAAPLTPAKRKKIVALREAGKGRNDIAREVGVSAGAVSKVIADAGMSFDRTATRHATEAKKADSRARRAEIAAQLLDVAQEAIADMRSEYLAYAFGGKDNIYREHTLPKPPDGARRNLMQTAAVALQRHMDLERHDADEKAADAKSMLLELGKALGVQSPNTAA